MDEKKDLEVFDDKNGVGIRSQRPPTAPQGTRRKAPLYYAGETLGDRLRGPLQKNSTNRVHKAIIGGRSINYPDVQRYDNGAVPGIRDKHARRMIRKAITRVHSRVEVSIHKARELKNEALAQAREEKKSTRWGLRVLAQELALHQPLDVPSGKEIRAMRTEARKKQRAYRKEQKRIAKIEAMSQTERNLDMLQGFTGGDQVIK